jgi:serine/threonine protein kinase
LAVSSESVLDRVLGDRYALESVLGEGGMATVYLARDQLLGRQVAVKLFNSAGIGNAGRQETEIGVLGSLNHHGLVNLFDAGLDEPVPGQTRRYLVMEFVRGMDLSTRMKLGAISPRHIAEIAFDIAEALEYVHANGVIHRDVKPSNILLVDYGNGAPRARAKLSDFGIALGEDSERLTREGSTTGTAAYLSPEQVAGARVTAASDVYALGLVILECFTRKVEYPGGVIESAVARVSRNPVIPPSLPDNWRALLGAMTARKPGNRPQPRELVASLRQIVMAESARHKDVSTALLPATDIATDDAIRSAYMDTFPDAALDRVTALASRLLGAPIAVVSVLDSDRIWLKSHVGSEVEQILQGLDLTTPGPLPQQTIVIEDTLANSQTVDNPRVVGPVGIRFFAGVPLHRDGRDVIGTLSVLDTKPHTVSEVDIVNLEDLAALVEAQLDSRREQRRATGEHPTAPDSVA